MKRALVVLTLALPALVRTVLAQQPLGDDAWNHGRYDEARSAYQRVVAGDSTAFRANLRLGVMLSWRGQHDSALAYIARARRSEPTDLEARLIEAKVMAWAGHHAEAVAHYDSVLTDHPGLVEAELGRARARAWRGDLGGAIRGYRAVLAAEPRNADALVGLGYVYHWQGRERRAARMARDALSADGSHPAARELRDAIRAVTRAATVVAASWSNDSDRNTNFWQTLDASAPLSPAIRIFGGVSLLEAADPVLDGTRLGGEAGLSWGIGTLQLTGAGGARRLIPDTADPRTAATYRGRVSWRPVSRFGLSVGYTRTPFDEIAGLIERGLDVESLEGGFEAAPVRGLSVYGDGGGAWFSDANHRTGAALGVTQSVAGGFFIGAYARTLSYERRGAGYFSPDRFRLLEGQAGYRLDRGGWDGRVSGGLGAQQIGRDGSAQTEWHGEARIGRRWGVGNRLDIFGTVTNSAVSSTSGAFRYRSAGVALKLGL